MNELTYTLAGVLLIIFGCWVWTVELRLKAYWQWRDETVEQIENIKTHLWEKFGELP